MIQYDGMKSEEMKGNSTVTQLPVGAYVAKVLDIKIEGNAPDQQLAIGLDVSEGEYEGFFMKKYKAAKEAGSKFGEVKFKGVFRLRIPNAANKKAMYPETDLRRFNDMIYRFESSNQGYHWDGDEQKLRGLTIGFSTQEDEYNGNRFTRIGRLESADKVRSGEVRPMPPRERKESGNPTTATPMDQKTGMSVVNTEELPFL